MSSNSDQPDLPISLPPATGPLRAGSAARGYHVRYEYAGADQSAWYDFHGSAAELIDALEVTFRTADVTSMTIRRIGA